MGIVWEAYYKGVPFLGSRSLNIPTEKPRCQGGKPIRSAVSQNPSAKTAEKFLPPRSGWHLNTAEKRSEVIEWSDDAWMMQQGIWKTDVFFWGWFFLTTFTHHNFCGERDHTTQHNMNCNGLDPFFRNFSLIQWCLTLAKVVHITLLHHHALNGKPLFCKITLAFFHGVPRNIIKL